MCESAPNFTTMKVIAFDQATKVTGYAIYSDGKLVNYGALEASGDNPFERMRIMYEKIYTLMCVERPDLISVEGTQFQNNYKVYSELSQMQGVVFAACFALGVSFCVTAPSVWKSYCGVEGRKRMEQKQSAMAIVESFGITATEDICEAILQGKYVTENMKG